MSDREWDEWRSSFATGGVAVDPGALVARARRETRRQALGLAAEVLVGAGAVVFYAALIVRGKATAPLLVIAAVSFVFVAVWLGYLLHVRRSTWRGAGEALRPSLELTLRRRRADARWFRFVRLATAAFGLVAAAWAPFQLSAYREVYAREPWRAVVGFGGALAILVLFLVYAGRRLERARREASGLELALAALDERHGDG
jgi:hypothetical protein